MSRIITDRRARFSIPRHLQLGPRHGDEGNRVRRAARDVRAPVRVGVEVRGRWWNGAWGCMSRRHIWLLSGGQLWRVRGRLGGDGGQEVLYDFTDAESARSMVDE